MDGISKKELIEIRRCFHKNPELGGMEYETMETICRYLDLWNIEYKKGVADTGVVAIVRGKNNGRTIGVRADIDALPISEDNDLEYKSLKKGIMHACGHDAHTAIALGAAKTLKSMENKLNGNVKFFFQPAEETTGGAKRMIDEGCLDNPKVDYVIGLHVDPNLPTGKIGLKYGKMMAASDEIKIVVKGKSTHGAHPDEGVDPIFIASNLILSLQSVISRNISPVNSAVFTIGSIHGGNKGNIIPDEVVLLGILRTLDEKTRDFMKNRVRTIVDDISKGMGGEGELFIRESYCSLINNDETVDVVKDAAYEAIGTDNVCIRQYPNMGTEDFAYFSKAVKSCFYNLGCTAEDCESIYPIHSSKFILDENCLPVGVKIHVESVLKLMK